MIEAGIIELVKESEWIRPIVVQDKKILGEFRICDDLRKLNDAFLHDKFPTPFTNEILETTGTMRLWVRSLTYCMNFRICSQQNFSR